MILMITYLRMLLIIMYRLKQDKGYGFAKDLTTKPNIYRAGLKYKNADWLFTLNANAVTGQSEKEFCRQ